MHNKLEPILGDFTALFQLLGGRPKLAFRLLPSLKPILTTIKKQLNNKTDMEPDPETKPDIYVTSTFTPTAPLQAPKISQAVIVLSVILSSAGNASMNSIKDKQARYCTKELIDISLISDSKEGQSNNRTFYLEVVI